MKKYTPVFGPQELFDNEFEPNAIAVIFIDRTNKLHATSEAEIDRQLQRTGSYVVAMRRIIKDKVDDENELENLYWEFDSQRSKKTTDERLLFKGKLRYYASIASVDKSTKEPNRWTWEDKKAGRLPEVGCKCVGILSEAIKRVVHVNKHIVAVENEKTLNVCNFTHEEFFRNHKPIETPAEKAQRLEDEWVNKAWSETAVFAGVTQDEHDRLRIHLRHIYRAQLSGELAAPKGGE